MENIKGGKVWLFGDNVNTNDMSPSRFSMLKDLMEVSKYCFADLRPEFGKESRDGEIIVAGKNFGCGSSRQRAPIAIKNRGIACVIAESFARTFLRNCVNMGFLVLELPDASRLIAEGDIVSVDIVKCEIFNQTKGETYKFEPIPEFMLDIYNAGGLEGYIVKRLAAEKG